MAETYTGEVRNGMVVFDEGTPPLPEGAKVQVELVDMEAAVQDLSRRLLSVAGIAKGLPSDFAEQHDHYIHGQPVASEVAGPPPSGDRMASTRAWLLAMAREAEADPEARSLPTDLAEHHDHYAHGKPRS